MIDTKKAQNIISLLFIIFSTTSLAQLAIGYNDFNLIKYQYMYGYVGILLISVIGFFSTKILVKKPNTFFLLRCIELHFVFFIIIIGSMSNFINLSSVFMLTIIITLTTLIKGNKSPFIILTLAAINYIIDLQICTYFGIVSSSEVLYFYFDVIILALASIYSYVVITSYGKTFWQLEQTHFETSKTNQLLNDSVAELSTLQEISKFSNSVLNIKELINLINDMIIGVIGVNYCSIFLVDDNDKFYLEATNISDKDTLNRIKSIISSKYLSDIRTNHTTVIEENLYDLKDYPISNNRNVKNTLISTLQSKRNFLGVILAESCFEGVFEERKKNMITTICNQVSIAIENAVIYDKMEKLATIDGLTQVHNRRYFNEVFLAEFADLQNNAPVCVSMIDIDNFKKINDTYGHLLGDDVLKKVSSIIKNTICASDSEDYLVARYGGEEFVILFRNTDLNTAKTMLEVVRKNIESASVEDEEQKVKFTISLGVAEYPFTSSSVKEILRDADSALYKAKQTGKNRVVSADMLSSEEISR